MLDQRKLVIKDVKRFIKDNYIPKKRQQSSNELEMSNAINFEDCLDYNNTIRVKRLEETIKFNMSSCANKSDVSSEKLEGIGNFINKNKSETFNTLLLAHLDTKGYLKDSDFYKKANIDRRLFSRLKNSDYHPSQKTSISLALALELSLADTENLLASAGYALSMSSKFDLAIQYFIINRIYDFFFINECLDSFGLKTLL